MKKILALACAAALFCLALVGCGGGNQKASVNNTGLEPGTYTVKFTTDSPTMFGTNEYYNGRGTLTVTKDSAELYVVLKARGIVNLYLGSAEDAQKKGAELLQPTEEVVKFDDGFTKECYGFTIPINGALNEEFDCAILGSKGKWYDHKVSISDPQPVTK